MPPIDPRQVTVDAVAMLALSHCPLCGGVGKQTLSHPYAPRIACRWCYERQQVIDRCLRWLKGK